MASRMVLFPALAVVAALGVGGLVAATAVQRLDAQQSMMLHTHRVIDTARTLLGDMRDAETGQRGFILTGREAYLEPYRRAEGDVDARLRRLGELTADNPAQQVRVQALAQLIGEKRAELARVLDLHRGGGRAAAQGAIETDAGRALMDDIRAGTGAIIRVENDLLEQRVAAARAGGQRVLLFALAGLLAALAVVAGAAWLLHRAQRREQRLRDDATTRAGLLQSSLDTIRDGLVMFDAQGRITACNAEFFRLLGLPPDLCKLGETRERMLTADAALEAPILAALFDDAEGAPRRQVARGRTTLELYRRATADGGVLLAAHDVTARLQNETVLRQAQKMEAIGQLTGGVAHDFNNLLQVVGANLDLIGRDVEPGSRSAQRVKLAREGVERGARLTRQLLAFARRQPLAPRSSNLGRIVGEMDDLLRRSLGEQIRMQTVVAGGLWNAAIDRDQLENAILNLAINARDAMPDGGHLTIEVANAVLDDAYAIANADVQSGSYVMVAVTDTGTGMSDDVLARVFEPFFSTKPEGLGTGLGLSQVYGFVKQSNGHVKIYSEPGHGTTVKLYLPRTREPEELDGDGASHAAEGGSETVLVVEDDEAVRRSVVDLLSGLGYRVLQAENGDSALAVVASGVAIDLLFTDMVMPGTIRGRELAQRARQYLPGLAVLFTSGYTQVAVNADLRREAGVDLLSKPYTRDALARRIRQVLARARPAPEPVVPDRAHLTLLVVEDDALLRQTTIGMLEDLGYVAFGAEAASEALAILERETVVQVLLTDVGLPGMDGLELAREVARRWPHIHIVVASGYDTARLTGLPDGAAVLPKPFRPEQLEQMLVGFAAGGSAS